MRLPPGPLLARQYHAADSTATTAERQRCREDLPPRRARGRPIPALQILQVRRDVAKRLIAPRAIFFEALGDDALEFGRDAGRHAIDGLGLCRQDGRECFWEAVAGQTAGAPSPSRTAPRRS